MIIPVILSGGSGTRLWPRSRESFPKQFLPMVESDTMLQATALRTLGLDFCSEPIVVCNEDHRFFVAEQLKQKGIKPNQIVLEPVGKNTAPAVTVASLIASAEDDDPILLIMPADHVITGVTAFHKSVEKATEEAMKGALVTFGVVPIEPNPGYGYIKVARKVDEKDDNLVHDVERFVEKPDLETAKRYLESKNYLWNSGMFLFKASAFLEEIEKFNPNILSVCKSTLETSVQDLDFLRLDQQSFSRCESDSIDYAVMEKTDKAVVVPIDVGWSDVGSWESLWSVGNRDSQNNLVDGDVFAEDTKNCYLHSEGRLVVAIGIENLVVVETGDAVLVMDKSRNEDVKKMVLHLKGKERKEAIVHRNVPRPWGTYETIDFADRFQVKRITVKAGERLSLQMHHHRAEHWIVVKGTARITRGDEVFVLSENESTFIPLGTKHRLENPGRIPLELIEVQSGSYLGEDDIVRFEDTYGRN